MVLIYLFRCGVITDLVFVIFSIPALYNTILMAALLCFVYYLVIFPYVPIQSTNCRKRASLLPESSIIGKNRSCINSQSFASLHRKAM